VIDRAVRETVVPKVAAVLGDPHVDAAGLLMSTLPALDAALAGGLASVRWFLSPYYSLEVPMSSSTAASSPRVLIREKFDFAAAHRLHVPTLSDDANRSTFGKCNNPKGHGHNYQFEPCVSAPIGSAFTVATLERLADQVLLERFDHTHLNEDTVEFDHRRGGVNPSVENIAMVFFNLLAPAVTAAGATLQHVSVWETDRTSATYPA
jgi:6-pyruvoyltetrahydropterin/6-carboxytetrahydropterin synthase